MKETFIENKTFLHLKHVGKLSATMFTTQAPPILDIATNTEHKPSILLLFSAQ